MTPAWNRRALRLARWLLIAFTALSAGAFLLGALRFPAIAADYARDHVPNTTVWTPAMTQAALAELGWPATTYAWFIFARDVWAFLVFNALAVLLLWRKRDDWLGLFAAFAFVVNGHVGDWLTLTLLGLAPGRGPLEALRHWEGAAGWQLFFILLYVFPDGRFVPAWTRWLLIVWAAGNLLDPNSSPYLYLLFVPLVLIAIGSQVYRYFWRSDAVQRQQTKWAVTMVGVGVLLLPTMLAYDPILAWAAGSSDHLYQGSGAALIVALVILALVNFWFSLFPLAVTIAILRYRLWDIDVILRRTLVYSALTALLALAYFGVVIVLQSAVTAVPAPAAAGPSAPYGGAAQVGGARSEWVTVASTLAIAALFFPLRARVQRFIDRRFYRRKYDAARVLSEFGVAARDETDLEVLAARLVRVVDEAIQPAEASLWLRSDERRERP